MTRKRFFIIIILISVFFSIFYLWNQSRRSITPPGFVADPLIPNKVTGEVNVTNKIAQNDFNFPGSLSLLNIEISEAFSESEAREIAANFGFTDQAEIVKDVFDGTSYIWRRQNDSLIIYGKSRRVEYSLNDIADAANRQLPDDTIINIATDFLNSSGVNQNLEFSFFTFLRDEKSLDRTNTIDRSQARIYQVNFSPSVSDIKLLTMDPKSSLDYVWVQPNGVIAKANITFLKNTSKSQESYKLKTYNDVVASIKSATVVSLDDGNIYLPSVKGKDIQSIELTEIDLAYLYDTSTSTSLKPVYTLKGLATFVGFPNKVNAYLYLPAIAN